MSSPNFAKARLSNGVELSYAAQGASDGVPVLFLHGWPDSWFSFSRVLASLPRTIRAFVPDQRGFGDSDRPSDGYAIEDFAADAVRFLDAVGLERAALVGHSFGTFVARRTAIAHPDRVTRLVLIGSGPSASNPVAEEVRAALANLSDPVPMEFAREFQASTAYLPLPDAFFERVVAESVKLPARMWRDPFEGMLAYDDTEQLGRIAAPTLLLWGERDALFSREDQERLLAAIPDARLTVYPETGHCLNWERPEQVAADLDRFLRGA